jgi:hypothetical protein
MVPVQLGGVGEAGHLAGVALEPFQHGQHREGDGGGDGLGDQVGVGVGDVAADRGQGAAADQQPAVAGPAGAAAGAADDAEHAVDGWPVRHHRDRGRLPPAVAGLDPQGIQARGRHRIGAQGDHHRHRHPKLQGDPVQPGHPPRGWMRRAGRRSFPLRGRADRPGAVALRVGRVGEGAHQAAASPSSVGRSTSTGARSSTCTAGCGTAASTAIARVVRRRLRNQGRSRIRTGGRCP